MSLQKKRKKQYSKTPNLPFNLVAVWWQDAYESTDDDPELKGDIRTITVGVIAKEDERFIYISNYFDGISKSFTDPWIAVPRELVREVVFYDRDKLQGVRRPIAQLQSGSAEGDKNNDKTSRSNGKAPAKARRNGQRDRKGR